MRTRTSLSVLSLLFIFILLASAAGSTLAQFDDSKRFDHSIDYNIGGRIDINREVGKACVTGVVKKQTIRGYGELTKSEDVRIAPHIMSIQETTEWTTAPDAIRNLTVTTRIELCARPMSTAARTYVVSPGVVVYKGDVIHTYHPWVVDGYVDVDSATRQLWMASITPNPGESGSYHSDFIAAYGPGPYEEAHGFTDDADIVTYYDEEYRWWFDDSKDDGIDRGAYYVGNYFTIDQYAATSDGDLRRYISMSSPFSNALLEEDMITIGKAEVREAFSMENVEHGPKAITLAWWDLF